MSKKSRNFAPDFGCITQKPLNMTQEELIARLQDIEWDDFEVKTAKSELPKNVAESVSAFANTQGGWIVLGVRQEGKHFEIQGVDNAEKLEQDFISSLRNQSKYNTLIASKQKKYNIDGNTVLAFYIYASDLKPVYFGGTLHNTFIRKGSGDQRASEAEISAMLRDQQYGIKSEQSIPETSIDMLSMESLNSYRSYVFKQPIVPLSADCSQEEFCRALNITDKNGLLTYSGLLMFGKQLDVRDYVPTFCLDHIEIPGRTLEEADTRYDYRMPEQANIWDSFVIMQRRLAIAIQRPFALDAQGLIEVGDNRYFEVAREALANMVMHADYFSSFRSCVHLFTNRIEFVNAGGLPIPAEQMVGQFYTNPRNPSIAKMFRVAHIAENAGFGMNKLRSWEQLTGGKAELTSQRYCTTLTLYLGSLVGDKAKTGHETGQETGHDGSKLAASHDQKQNILDKMSDIMSDKLSKKEIERMKVIISYLLEHDIITTSKAAELLQVGDKTAQRLLSKGEAVGFLDGKGENKGKQYNLKDLM